MGFPTAAILLVVLLAMAVVAWGALAARRSSVVSVVALAVAGLAGLLSYYSAVETQSMAWVAGYGAVALLSAGVAVRHLLGRSP